MVFSAKGPSDHSSPHFKHHATPSTFSQILGLIEELELVEADEREVIAGALAAARGNELSEFFELLRERAKTKWGRESSTLDVKNSDWGRRKKA